MKETDTLLQENNLESAIDAIKNGEVIGIPTETVYGIGVDPYSQTAVDKIFSLKERSDTKPLSILISSFYEIQKLNLVTTIPDVVELYWPGPLTIIVETSNDFANGVGTKEPSSIGVRVPENELAINLLKLTGPLAVTSANISGEEEASAKYIEPIIAEDIPKSWSSDPICTRNPDPSANSPAPDKINKNIFLLGTTATSFISG